ncbi:MAG: biotin carboxylase N-terminal domain-containing protein [Myxococcota bacterium]|nr:biotin carboxylase N-terminal domain-containing protein [Myxococcota bacterium]
MKKIERILIANRGEIALRIISTCKKLGIHSVAVYSEADKSAPHVMQADEAVLIGPAPSVDSYLCIDKIIDAAKKTSAQAIHPGYGFLAENAGFAQACIDAGLIFIGPNPDVIEKMGSKKVSKSIVEAAGVPVIPGFQLADTDIPFPVLLKASAGGGGKGMRIVRAADELKSAAESAKREALSSFGDDTLLLEKYIEQPRHIEVQILGDHHGNIVHVFERECSIQRRHQKIIEESPSPVLTPELRNKICEAGVTVASAIGYQSAGTVEFVYAPTGEFYFLEVNTRLQVEHPVTEMVSGLDLVELQIQVAEGIELPFTQSDLTQTGSAIELRIYAEDPSQNFLPVTGTLCDWHLPSINNVRLDSGVRTGSEVGIHYDPMLAKLIGYGANRAEAIRQVQYALSHFSIGGITSNYGLLNSILRDTAFRDGDFDTHYLDENLPRLLEDKASIDVLIESAVAVALSCERTRHESATMNSIPSGFRNNRFRGQNFSCRIDDETITLQYHQVAPGRYSISHGERQWTVSDLQWESPSLAYTNHDGVRRSFRIQNKGRHYHCHSILASLGIEVLDRFPEQDASDVAGACVAPMPGKVIAVNVQEGAEVTQNQPLVILEAMKMEHTVSAPCDGIIEKLLVREGQQVDAAALLAVVSGEEGE